MRLGYCGRVPGGVVRRVGVEGGGGISPCVHESGQETSTEAADNGSTESGLESSYMEQSGAGKKSIICSR